MNYGSVFTLKNNTMRVCLLLMTTQYKHEHLFQKVGKGLSYVFVI